MLKGWRLGQAIGGRDHGQESMIMIMRLKMGVEGGCAGGDSCRSAGAREVRTRKVANLAVLLLLLRFPADHCLMHNMWVHHCIMRGYRYACTTITTRIRTTCVYVFIQITRPGMT